MDLYAKNRYALSRQIIEKPGFCRFEREWKLVPSKEDKPGLTCLVRDRMVTIHSPYYPLQEAQRLAESLTQDSGTTILLGMGLGYHLPFLSGRWPQRRFVIIEPDRHLFHLALQHADLTSLSKHFLFVIGWEEYEVIRHIEDIDPDFHAIELRQRCRLDEGYFDNVQRRLSGGSVYDPGDGWRYPKFVSDPVRVLFIDSGYVLTRECLTAIEEAGHQVQYLHIDKEKHEYQDFIRNFLQRIRSFRPDFVLTINHLGFDKEGRLTELLSQLEIPYVSWYVDSPNVILDEQGTNISDWCSIFVWDRDYIADVRQAGYPWVDYLPLATLPQLFAPMDLPFRHDIGFVGSSMVYSVHKNLRRMVWRSDLLGLLDQCAMTFLQMDTRHVEEALEQLALDGLDLFFDSREQELDYHAAVMWRATQIYRLGGLRRLEPFYPTVFGDPNWDDLLDHHYRIRREVMYYDDLPRVYNTCRINFNMTSRQMKNAVNQRVFDVPSCNGFLLTDHKQQLEEIFDLDAPEPEVVFFDEVGQIPDLVRFYLHNDSQRKAVATRGRRRVLEGHTYVHRIREMIDIMKKRYG